MNAPDILYGAEKIDLIMKKPGMKNYIIYLNYVCMCIFLVEFSFLVRYYHSLYQSFIPNCSITIARLHQHISIPDNVEKHILSGTSRRNRCQRLLDYLLVQLDTDRNYMQFCYYLSIVSVMTNLPYRMIAGQLFIITYAIFICV